MFTLDVEETLGNLLTQEDTDHDTQITIDDTGPKVGEGSVSSQCSSRR